MKTYQKLILLICITGLMAACSTTTQLRKTWSDPSLATNPVKPFKKVLVLVKAKTEVNRRAAEDELVKLIKNGSVIPSYTYLTPTDTSQKELAEKLIKDGYDGVITMRVKAVVQTKTRSENQGTSYANWYGYSTPYGYGYGVSYNIGSSANDGPSTVDVNSAKDYIIETNIYSLESKKLLWSGVTASMSAKKIDPAMNGIVNTIRNELHKKGFVQK